MLARVRQHHQTFIACHPSEAVPCALAVTFALALPTAADRYLDKTARTREINYRHVDYMARFDQKYADLNGKLDRFDGNPFT